MALATKNKVTGLENVIKNLNVEIAKIKGLSMKGLIEAAILIRRDMDTTPPVIPVDLGNLRASSFVVASKKSVSDGNFVGPNAAEMTADHTSFMSQQKQEVAMKLLVAIGLSANYAAAVEEDTIAKRKRPGSGGQFFQSAITRNKPFVIKVVQKTAKVR